MTLGQTDSWAELLSQTFFELFIFEAGSHCVAMAILEFTMWINQTGLELTEIHPSSCLCLERVLGLKVHTTTFFFEFLVQDILRVVAFWSWCPAGPAEMTRCSLVRDPVFKHRWEHGLCGGECASLLQKTPAAENGGPLQEPHVYTCTKCARCTANIQNNPNSVCSSTLHTSPKSKWVQGDHRTQNRCCGDASARSPAKNKPRALSRLFPVLQTASTISPVPSTASDINPTFLSRLTECPPPQDSLLEKL